jgi:enoyl-CoA hydratase/carnithine racemase
MGANAHPESKHDWYVLRACVVLLSELEGDALLRDIDVGKPVIAAINGHAIAGGLEVVLGTDIRYAHAHVRAC